MPPDIAVGNRAEMAAGPSVISRNSRLGGYFVVFRKSITVADGPARLPLPGIRIPIDTERAQDDRSRGDASACSPAGSAFRRAGAQFEDAGHAEAEQHHADPRQQRIQEDEQERARRRRHLRVQADPDRPLLIEQLARRPDRIEQVVRRHDRDAERETGAPPKPLQAGESTTMLAPIAQITCRRPASARRLARCRRGEKVPGGGDHEPSRRRSARGRA